MKFDLTIKPASPLKKTAFFLMMICLFAASRIQAQKVTYAEPDKEDLRTLNFEIIGKMNGQYLIYKSIRDNHYMSLYDNDMKMVSKHKLSFMPDRVINTEYLAYPDFFYLFFQYQKRNIVYAMAAKMDASGKLMGEPQILDTTNINFFASNKIYSISPSENKQYISVLKINSRNDKNYIIGNALYDRSLQLVHKTQIGIPMPERNDFLTEFNVDNDGGLVFLRNSGTSQNDNINKVTLLTQPKGSDMVSFTPIPIENVFLDDVQVKINNANGQYLVSSFFAKLRRGNIEGLFNYLVDKRNLKTVSNSLNVFNNDLRNEARGENADKAAFNDYFLQKIVMRNDGGFLVVSEANYTSSRGNAFNRWDNVYPTPYLNPLDYYYFRSYYPFWRGGTFSNNSVTRYYADDILVLSFDPSSKIEWSNVIHKSQYDDNTDNFIGFTTMNLGNELDFLFNMLEKRTLLLNDQAILANGQLERKPVFKNLDKGFDFMPRFGKQVSAREMIIPCQYRNYICFAKIEY
ncbi:MAG: hypothetical protein JWN76_396 [Chitinophagaceae bacterium]|nr:hypothetical protein [Chitinophagaceae bacterium]